MHEDSGNRKEIEMAVNNQNDDGSKSEEISKGRKRFRRKEDATQVKIKRVREKHPLRESCQSNCRLECNMKISHTRRQNIWSSFWKLSHNERRAFAYSCIARKKPQRVSNKTPREKKRNFSHIYQFKDEFGTNQNICKVFFLTTLGFKKSNDSVISNLWPESAMNDIAPKEDGRGKHSTRKTVDKHLIRKHVETFNPGVSHYRREHAPNKLYLPSDISIKMMWENYEEKYPSFQCSYNVYRSVVSKEINISFTKLGVEQCELCLAHEKAEHEHLSDESCSECDRWKEHVKRAQLSRESYQRDCSTDWPSYVSVRSVDLQKVIMLPRIPGVKTIAFTKRLIAFHETFAAVGKVKTNKPSNISVVWHEGLAGRSAVEIASCFYTLVECERDVTHFHLWADNCTAQNKNWCLYSCLVQLVNSPFHQVQEIILNYLETGHTFMSADSVHAGVEKEIRKQPSGNVYDFDDFVEIIQNSNSKKVVAIKAQLETFRAWKKLHSQTKLKSAPKLAELRKVKFIRGKKVIFYKLSHNQEEEFVELDFLKQKANISILPPPMRNKPRGIPAEKKRNILSHLCQYMPVSRERFWTNLEESEDVEDLVTNY